MRAKMITQSELNFEPPSLKITQEFYAKYDRISRLLDENPAILDRVHGDLAALAEWMEGKGHSRYASDTVLRLCVCQVIERLSLRETIVRVDTCGALRRFVRVDGCLFSKLDRTGIIELFPSTLDGSTSDDSPNLNQDSVS